MKTTTDPEEEYLSTYESTYHNFGTAARDAMWSSMQGGAKQADSRRYWCSALFTRLCTTARSLLVLCPGSTSEILANWDFASVASLSRNLFEAYLLFAYFSERVEGEEWRTRLNVMQLCDCTSRIKLFEQYGEHDTAKGFLDDAADLKSRLEGNDYFKSLEPKLQTQLLQGHRPALFTNRELSSRLKVDVKTWGYYELLSAHAHTLPLSFYRMDEQGRTGVANAVDQGYTITAMEFATEILREAKRTFEEDFSDVATFKPTTSSIPELLQARLGSIPLSKMNRAQRRAIERPRRKRL